MDHNTTFFFAFICIVVAGFVGGQSPSLKSSPASSSTSAPSNTIAPTTTPPTSSPSPTVPVCSPLAVPGGAMEDADDEVIFSFLFSRFYIRHTH